MVKNLPANPGDTRDTGLTLGLGRSPETGNGRKKHKLESRLPGEISITSDMQMTHTLMAESEEELKSLLMKVKGE